MSHRRWPKLVPFPRCALGLRPSVSICKGGLRSPLTVVVVGITRDSICGALGATDARPVPSESRLLLFRGALTRAPLHSLRTLLVAQLLMSPSRVGAAA